MAKPPLFVMHKKKTFDLSQYLGLVVMVQNGSTLLSPTSTILAYIADALIMSDPKQLSCKKRCGPQECCCEKRYEIGKEMAVMVG